MRIWWTTFAVVAVAGQLAVGMRASDTASVTGDEPFYLLTTQSLVSDGDLDLRDEYAQREMDRFWDGSVPLWKQMEPAPDGRLLSPHDPGLSIISIPAYAVGGLRGVQRFLVVLWAAAMATAALLARRAGVPGRPAALAAAIVGVGTPGVVYASQVYPEGAAALCIAAGLLIATRSPTARPRPLVLAAVLIALAWLGIKYVPLGAVVAVWWAWRFRSDRGAVAVATIVCGVAAVHYGWWHLDTFGSLTPYSTNVVWAGEGTAEILDSHFRIEDRVYRLYGVFLDARFGLFRWLPFAALAVLGVAVAARRVVGHVAVLAAAVFMATFVSITIMGWWFPGRVLIAAFPALVVLCAAGASRLPRTALVLGAWSVVIGVALVWSARTGGIRLAVDPFDLGFPLPPAALFPDFRAFGPEQVAKTLGWAVALIAAAVPLALRRASARDVEAQTDVADRVGLHLADDAVTPSA